MATTGRYTRFVAIIKRSLWVLVVAVIGLLVWIASDSTGENKARMVFSGMMKSEALKNIMVSPHYQGVDAQNRPFTVIAKQATQVDDDNVDLTDIRADIEMSEGKWAALVAGAGRLNTKTKQLDLTGGVDIFYDEGYEFRTDHAHVDINAGSAYGDTQVEGQGPLGTLKSNGFLLKDRGQTIYFDGAVKMKLYRQ